MINLKKNLKLSHLCTDHAIDSKLAGRFRPFRKFMMEFWDAELPGLVPDLYPTHALSYEEMDELDSSTCRTDRLLSMLSQKSSRHVEEFLGALDYIGRRRNANKMRGKQTKITVNFTGRMMFLKGRKANSSQLAIMYVLCNQFQPITLFSVLVLHGNYHNARADILPSYHYVTDGFIRFFIWKMNFYLAKTFRILNSVSKRLS
jgi:hypothetical protein